MLHEKELEVKELENKLAYVLGKAYTLIPWSKIRVQSAYKFFIDRIRASTNTRTFKEFIDVFCNKIGVEFVSLETTVIEYLDENSARVMDILRKETLYIANFSIETADLIKKEKNIGGKK